MLRRKCRTISKGRPWTSWRPLLSSLPQLATTTIRSPANSGPLGNPPSSAISPATASFRTRRRTPTPEPTSWHLQGEPFAWKTNQSPFTGSHRPFLNSKVLDFFGIGCHATWGGPHHPVLRFINGKALGRGCAGNRNDCVECCVLPMLQSRLLEQILERSRCCNCRRCADATSLLMTRPVFQFWERCDDGYNFKICAHAAKLLRGKHFASVVQSET